MKVSDGDAESGGVNVVEEMMVIVGNVELDSFNIGVFAEVVVVPEDSPTTKC